MRIPAGTDLTALSGDQLAAAYGEYNARALAAPVASRARARAVAARERVGDEVSRRGLLIRRSLSDGAYMVGRPSAFEPIVRGA